MISSFKEFDLIGLKRVDLHPKFGWCLPGPNTKDGRPFETELHYYKTKNCHN